MFRDAGILLIAFGFDYERIAPRCAMSVRKFSDVGIHVVTNIPAHLLSAEWKRVDNVSFTHLDLLDSENRKVKTDLIRYTPFQRTLYIDVDSEVVSGEFVEVFDVLSVVDAVFPKWRLLTSEMIRTDKRGLYDRYTHLVSTIPVQMVAGGVCGFRKSDAASAFFRSYSSLYESMGRGQDMPALNTALHKSGISRVLLERSRYNGLDSNVIRSMHNTIDSSVLKGFVRKRTDPSTGVMRSIAQGTKKFFDRKRVAIIYDVVGWAFYNMAWKIKADLNGFDVDVVPVQHDVSAYDAVLSFSPRVMPMGVDPKKVLCGVSSHGRGQAEQCSRYAWCFSNDPAIFEQLPKGRRSLIRNAVDTDVFRTDGRSRTGGVVGAVGSVSRLEHKGYSRIKRVCDVRGFEYRPLFPDPRQEVMTPLEMVEWYAGIDVLVVSSVSETGPNTVLEAMACGVPVVANPVGLVPDVVVDGINGYIVDDLNDTDAYGDAISSVLRQYESMSRNAAATARKFGARKMTAGYRYMLEDFFAAKPESVSNKIEVKSMSRASSLTFGIAGRAFRK